MNINKWLGENAASLDGKLVAVTGTTGGIGRELCSYIAALGANLLLVDRNAERSAAFARELAEKYGVTARTVTVDLEDMESVKRGTELLLSEPIDVFIHNAGAYSIPRKTCTTGYDNVFQINFVSPYYIIRTLLPRLSERGGKVVAVGSIAKGYSKTDANDVDFATRGRASLVYGNAKRYLMFALHELFRGEAGARLSITHPGISFTGITAHYPKVIFAIIKYPMKLIFMKPRKASLSVLKGVFDETKPYEWIGPRLFGIWGKPKKSNIGGADSEEIKRIADTADKIYLSIKNGENAN